MMDSMNLIFDNKLKLLRECYITYKLQNILRTCLTNNWDIGISPQPAIKTLLNSRTFLPSYLLEFFNNLTAIY